MRHRASNGPGVLLSAGVIPHTTPRQWQPRFSHSQFAHLERDTASGEDQYRLAHAQALFALSITPRTTQDFIVMANLLQGEVAPFEEATSNTLSLVSA